MEDQGKQPADAADEGTGGPVDESTVTVGVPRADGDGEEVIGQQPVGHGQVLGGGEYPDPEAPPRGPEEVEEG